MTLRVKINQMKGFSDVDLHFLYKALRLQEAILNSQDFKLRWLALSPKHNKGMSQQEIYNKIMKGHSRFEDVVDYELDYFLQMYKLKKGTLASTVMSNGVITINKMQFQIWKMQEHGHVYLSSSLFHEALHSQFGFTHPWFPPKWKRKSVPYVGGYLMRSLGEMVVNGRKLTPLKKDKE